MSVQKIGGRFTSSEEEFKKNSLSPESYIYVSPDDGFHASYYSADLTVGDGWSNSYSESSKVLHSINSNLKIGPLASIVVELAEDIWIPHNRYGIVVPTGEAGLTHGLLFAPTKVEPNWKGRLKIRVFNSSSTKVTIQQGQRIASLIIFSTSDMVHQAEVSRPTDISVRPLNLLQRLSRSYRDSPTHWSPIAIFSGAVLGAIMVLVTLVLG